MFDQFVKFVREIYQTDKYIPLHEPLFTGNEKKYLENCIDSGFVSSVGEYVNQFEDQIAKYLGSDYAVAIVNGTSALHLALHLAGVEQGDEVITQSLTFIATANAISYINAAPVFIDVDKETLGLSPTKLEYFLKNNTEMKDGFCVNKTTQRKIKACIPMHTFGHPLKIDQIVDICSKYNMKVLEDAAESLGSRYKNKQTGSFGLMGILSFNGNKIITTGGGGMIVTNNKTIALQAKHLSTQAKIPHKWEFDHDRIGYNYRMPNINAALGCAQLENIEQYITDKRQLADLYKVFFNKTGIDFFVDGQDTYSNYWLNVILLKDKAERDQFLTYSNDHQIMTRPAWRLMHKLNMYKNYQHDNLENSEWLEDRIVNIPSSVRKCRL